MVSQSQSSPTSRKVSFGYVILKPVLVNEADDAGLTLAQMAKRKAEELEDFGGALPSDLSRIGSKRLINSPPPSDDATEVPQTIFTKHSRQEVEAGTALVAEYLSAWRSHLPEKKEDLTEEAEWKALREVGEEFRARIEASPYCRQLLDEF